MKRRSRILTRLYGLLLKLYPRAYQAEYGEELQAVFNMTVTDTVQRGGLSVVSMSLRELRDLPGAIALEHLRERRKQNMGAEGGARLTPGPGSWRETLAALAPFLIFGALPTAVAYLRLTDVPRWLEVVLALSMLSSLVALLVIAIIQGFPRWFLPYVGFPLALFSVYGAFGLMRNWPRALLTPWDSWIVRQTVYQGVLWSGLLAAAFCVSLITRIVSPWRALHRRLRRDWTLLPFALYGATLFALLLTFDDYAGEEPYKIAAMLLLAAGGWFYLRSVRPWRRSLALFIGLTSAMAVAAAGKAILYSSSSWPYPRHFTWQTEALSTVIMWAWLALAIFGSGLLGLLARSDSELQAE
jgi:hypothetical protein